MGVLYGNKKEISVLDGCRRRKWTNSQIFYLSSQMTGQAIVTPTLSAQVIFLSASMLGSASISSTVRTISGFSATLTGQASLSGSIALGAEKLLQISLLGEATVAPIISMTQGLQIDILSVASCSGALSIHIPIQVMLTGEAILYPNLQSGIDRLHRSGITSSRLLDSEGAEERLLVAA